MSIFVNLTFTHCWGRSFIIEMGLIKEIIYKALGPRVYFRLISTTFLALYRIGFLKLFAKFQGHYLAGRLIDEGDYIIDIGANLGYFTTIFARKAGMEGKVMAVEPVGLYLNILRFNTRKYNNIEIIPFALGEKDGDALMGIPDRLDSRHGLTRIIKPDEQKNIRTLYEAEVRKPDSLFKNIKKLNYIKCDIEGHEGNVIPGFEDVIRKFRPMIQIELAEKNHVKIESFLYGFGYSAFHAKGKYLSPAGSSKRETGDLFFLTEKQIEKHGSTLLKQNVN